MTNNTSFSQIGFFIFVFVSYLLLSYSTRSHMSSLKKHTSKLIVLFSVLILVLALYGYIEIFKPFNSECYNNHYETLSGCKKDHKPKQRLLEITPGKICTGGPYTWQGNSERAKMCRKLASTEEGLESINRYNCGSTYHGMPGKCFKFTPLSNDKWRNSRCDTEIKYNLDGNGIF